jgi:glycosyltransferase involved in cell wall biosynthesis
MKTIAFHDNNLCLRGTTNAMYAYADYNEKILGNKSIIITTPFGNLDALEKFQRRFDEVHLIPWWEYVPFLKSKDVDFFYAIKAGHKSDGLLIEEIPTLIHAVFCHNEPHGHRYCYVSDWLSKNQGYDPEKYSVPHIAEKLPPPPYDLREKLGIPSNATVFGYLGGSTEFSVYDVWNAIKQTISERNDIYFLLMNIEKFCEDSPNVIHLPGTWDLNEKSSFIHACDAMLHARRGGETFGCSVAEFTMCNKPVVTYEHVYERAHIEILGERGIYYKNYEDVYDMINNLKKYITRDDYYKAYDDYSPEKIMDRFNKNFLM